MRFTFHRLILIGAATALWACGADAPPPALMVGKVAYTDIELGLLTRAEREDLATLAAFGQFVSEGRLDELGAPFVAREKQSLLLQKLAAEVAAREIGVDEEALREAYEAAPEYELTVRHLVVLAERWRAPAEREDALARAQAALARIEAGEDFGKVAGEVSEEPGAKARGGLLSPGRKGTWVREFWEAASALDVGEHSGIVETEYGYHVIKLEDRTIVPLEEVRDEILSRLVDLADAVGRAESWAQQEASALEVRNDAIAAWRAGDAADTIVLAKWPGGEYRASEFAEYLLTLQKEDRARLEAATEVGYAAVVAGAARNALLADRAAALGITLSAAEVAAAQDRWLRKAEQWATALGFTRGASPPVVAATALRALSAHNQGARLARDEVLGIAAALQAHYPIYIAPDSTTASSGSR